MILHFHSSSYNKSVSVVYESLFFTISFKCRWSSSTCARTLAVYCARFQVSVAMQIKSSLFWDVTQRISAVSYRRFGKNLSVIPNGNIINDLLLLSVQGLTAATTRHVNRNFEGSISRRSSRNPHFLRCLFTFGSFIFHSWKTKFVPPYHTYLIRSAKLCSIFVTIQSFPTHFTLLCRQLFLGWFVRSNLTGGNSFSPSPFIFYERHP